VNKVTQKDDQLKIEEEFQFDSQLV